MREPGHGDPVRVTFEGVADDRDGLYGVLVPGGTYLYPHTLKNAVSVEVIEPEYEVGSVYLDTRGRIFRRNRNNWFDITTGNGTYFGDDIPKRPLRKLVPEGDA